jgi:hypothetical protein
MDKDVLVKEGQNLIRHLDESKAKPRGAIWVYSSDSDTWRLWIVPSKEVSDKSEFYRIVSETISKHRSEMPGLDVSSIEFQKADHPAIVGLGRFLRMEGLGSAHFSNNRFNGFFLPDGVVLRMAI